VFEIGNSLREARMRRGVDFAQAELATKIRGKYLRALEDEQFELLPAETYVKGFLRNYAEYLGLDGQLYVDEFNSRFVSGEEHEPRARRSAARPQRHNRRLETSVVLGAIAVITVLTVIVISAWTSTGNKPRTSSHKPPAVKTPKVIPPHFLVTALRGATHVTVRIGSASGPVRWDGTLQVGDDPVAIRGSRRLWVQIDSPENVQVEVRGKQVHVRTSGPAVRIVTATGWHRP
jgi:cytoskeletal protein RodZ